MLEEKTVTNLEKMYVKNLCVEVSKYFMDLCFIVALCRLISHNYAQALFKLGYLVRVGKRIIK